MEMQRTACLQELKGSQPESVDSKEATGIGMWTGAFPMSACMSASCMFCAHVCFGALILFAG